MATDRTTPGTFTPEDARPKELTISGITALKDRYLVARGLENSGNFHIENKSKKGFAQYSITPEGDAWILAVVINEPEVVIRHELGVRPNENQTLTPYAFTRLQGKTEIGSDLFETYLDKTYLDKKYPDTNQP